MSKRNKVRVSKICLDIEGKTIELSLKQAQKLRDLLNETFGEETVTYVDRYHRPYMSYYGPKYRNTAGYMTTGGYTTTSGNIIETSNNSSDVSASCNYVTLNETWEGKLEDSVFTLRAVA